MQQYNICGLTVRVSGKGLNHISGFPVFSSVHTKKDAVTIDLGEVLSDWNLKSSNSFLLDEIPCEFGYANGCYLYKMIMADGNHLLMKILLKEDEMYVSTNMDEHTFSLWLGFAIWLALGIFSVSKQIVAIHASTIMYQGKSILFLGESGTGKSTHTSLWLKHIPDTELLNDDSPFVYASENKAIVYGSPWSGKTHCYKNIHTPIAGIVRLSQAPHNKIKRLSKLSAIGALLPSCPPAFAGEEILSDRICEILSSLIQQVPVYSLECLPDENAAQLVFSTLKNDGHI